MKQLDLILDTDVGSDCDDMMAMAYLVYATRHLNLSLRAVTYSNGVPEGPATIRAFFRTLGEAVPPVGTPTVPLKPHDNYCRELVARFGTDEDRAPTENAVTVLRRALSESENAVICGVGALTNIAALLTSGPDDISPLDGVALVRRRCARIVLMAGIFDPAEPRTEWNIHLDIPAAKTVTRLCPVPLVFLPSETGINMITGGPIMKKYGEQTPLSLSFLLFPGVKQRGGRHSWDPATAVYAVEGCKDLLTESERGTVSVDDEGKTAFSPSHEGLHSILTIKEKAGLTVAECKAMAAAYIDACAMQIYK